MIYKCFVCGRHFARSEGGYVSVQSDDGFSPVCKGHFLDLCGTCGKRIIDEVWNARKANGVRGDEE